jgi:hypothetical protein
MANHTPTFNFVYRRNNNLEFLLHILNLHQSELVGRDLRGRRQKKGEVPPLGPKPVGISRCDVR